MYNLRSTTISKRPPDRDNCHMKRILSLILPVFFLVSCTHEQYTPKPVGYARIELPVKQYRTFERDYCPCTFEYPVYGDAIQKLSYFNEKPDHPCWVNIEFPYFNGTLHMSYVDVRDTSMLEQVIGDAYRYAFKHTIKADFIDETHIDHENVHGVLFDIGGNVASSVQFFATDSLNHYIRGSLYFNEEPNVDSLRPVINFLREDIVHMVKTIKWI